MTGQYFEASPTTPSARHRVTLTLPDLTFCLQTDRSVFSFERIDSGTKILLLDAPAPAPEVKNVLDLGCGYGPIALTLAQRAPAAEVWATDTNQRALDLCAENAAALGATRVHPVLVSETDPTGTIPDDLRFDLIWSNPPIRIGKVALHALLVQWLDRLTPDGVAILVVQKHLGSDSLHQWLIAEGYPTERQSTRSGYRLLAISPRIDTTADTPGPTP